MEGCIGSKDENQLLVSQGFTCCKLSHHNRLRKLHNLKVHSTASRPSSHYTICRAKRCKNLVNTSIPSSTFQITSLNQIPSCILTLSTHFILFIYLFILFIYLFYLFIYFIYLFIYFIYLFILFIYLFYLFIYLFYLFIFYFISFFN